MFWLTLCLYPLLVQGRLGSGIVDLSPRNFDSFMEQNSKAIVDFVDGQEDQTAGLLSAIRLIRNWGSTVPMGRLDATKYPDIAKRYFNFGCSDETQECGDRFPQLLWFNHGQPTQYHRMLREPMNIASFVIALDRDPISTVDNMTALEKWNQAVLIRCPRRSELYRTVEVAASRHMDSAAFVHIETAGGQEVSWAVNGTISEVFSGEPSVDGIDAWVRAQLTLSESVPDSPAGDGSVIVVGKTFEQLVLRKDADVMLIVHAPWCGFCRKVMPQWAKFATLLQAAPGAPVVAKMDGTVNRSPLEDFHPRSFPTVLYVRKGERKPITYHGTERTVEAFLEFAKQHSTSPIELASEAHMLMQQTAVSEL